MIEDIKNVVIWNKNPCFNRFNFVLFKLNFHIVNGLILCWFFISLKWFELFCQPRFFLFSSTHFSHSFNFSPLSQATNATTLMVIINNGCVRVRKKVYETNAYSWLIFWFQTQCWRKNLNSFKSKYEHQH